MVTAHQPPTAGELWPDQEWCDDCGFAINGTVCDVCEWSDEEARERWKRIWVWPPAPAGTGDQRPSDAG